jgi:hypothetical protein
MVMDDGDGRWCSDGGNGGRDNDHVLMAGTMVGVIETRAMKRMMEQDV